MAASATTLSSSFSSLSIHSSTFFYKQTPIPNTHFSSSFTTKSHHKPTTSPICFSSSSFPSKPHKPKPKPIKAYPEEIENRTFNVPPPETIFYENQNSEEDFSYEPPPRPEGYMPTPSFDQLPLETEDEIAAAYEELYGPAYSGVSVLGNDVDIMDSKIEKKSEFLTIKKEGGKDEFEERVVQVRRVTKVVKGGKQMNFRSVVIVGDGEGRVGVGVGKAKEVISSVRKAATDARRHVIMVPMTKYLTFPHRADGDYGAARVMLRPASAGTGVIAGGTVRVVLELAGVKNALGKQIRSKNALNNARATLVAIQKMRQFSEVAEQRGIPMEELWK